MACIDYDLIGLVFIPQDKYQAESKSPIIISETVKMTEEFQTLTDLGKLAVPTDHSGSYCGR